MGVRRLVTTYRVGCCDGLYFEAAIDLAGGAAVVNTQQEFTLDFSQGSGQAIMVGQAEIRPIAGCSNVRRIAIKEGMRPVVSADAVGKVELLDDHAGQAFMAAVDGSQGHPVKTGTALGTVAKTAAGGASFAAKTSLQDHIKPGGPLNISQAGLGFKVRELAAAVRHQ